MSRSGHCLERCPEALSYTSGVAFCAGREGIRVLQKNDREFDDLD
jgi:hypothetical protein